MPETRYITKPRRFHQGLGHQMRNAGSAFGSFSDRWQPPDAGEAPPAFITLINGNYEQEVELADTGEKGVITTHSWTYFRHWMPFAHRYETCSAGLKLYTSDTGAWVFQVGSGPCELCNADGVNNPQLIQAATIGVWGLQHEVKTKVPGQDRERTSWELCAKRGCPHCDAGNTPVPVRRAWWPARSKDMAALGIYEAENLGLKCSAGCDEDMHTAGSQCGNCPHIFIALEETSMTEAEFQSHLSAATTCPDCNSYEYPQPIRECPTCGNTESPEIYDVRIKLVMKKESTTNRRGRQQNRYELQLLGDRKITAEQQAQLAEIAVPYDFDQIVGPSSLDEQRALLNEPTRGGQGQPSQQLPASSQNQYVDYNRAGGQHPAAPPTAPPLAGRPDFFRKPNLTSGQR